MAVDDPIMTGTAEITNGSDTATFTGVTLTDVVIGDTLAIGNNPPVVVKEVTSTTVLKIWGTWLPATASGAAYKLYKDSPRRAMASLVMSRQNALLDKLEGQLRANVYATVPSNAIGQNGDWAIVTATDPSTWYRRESGIWVSKGDLAGNIVAIGGRLGPYGKMITDANNAIESGLYMGLAVTNAPDAGWWLYSVVAHTANYVVQTAIGFTAAVNVPASRRERRLVNGVWDSAWTPVLTNQTALDARYRQLSAAADITVPSTTTVASVGDEHQIDRISRANGNGVTSAFRLVTKVIRYAPGTDYTGVELRTQAVIDASARMALRYDPPGYPGGIGFSNGAGYAAAPVNINAAGRLILTNPLVLGSFTVGTLPAASSMTGAIAHCSNETGGAVPVFSDGTNWRRVTDRAIAA